MTEMGIVISDLENISEILFNNGYCGWGNAIQKAIRLLKEQQEKIKLQELVILEQKQ